MLRGIATPKILVALAAVTIILAAFVGARLRQGSPPRERRDLNGYWYLGLRLDRGARVLENIELYGSPPYGAILLPCASLTNVRFVGANLRNADLQSAELNACDLRGADLTGANLNGTTFDRATRWPAGFDPQAQGARLVE